MTGLLPIGLVLPGACHLSQVKVDDGGIEVVEDLEVFEAGPGCLWQQGDRRRELRV